MYVYSEFTPEDGCSGGDGYSALFIGRIKPKSSNSDYEKILPSQNLLTNRISNKDYSCCSGFNRFYLLVVDKNTTNEDRENFEREDEEYYERRNEYSYLELLELLGDKETVEID